MEADNREKLDFFPAYYTTVDDGSEPALTKEAIYGDIELYGKDKKLPLDASPDLYRQVSEEIFQIVKIFSPKYPHLKLKINYRGGKPYVERYLHLVPKS